MAVISLLQSTTSRSFIIGIIIQSLTTFINQFWPPVDGFPGLRLDLLSSNATNPRKWFGRIIDNKNERFTKWTTDSNFVRADGDFGSWTDLDAAPKMKIMPKDFSKRYMISTISFTYDTMLKDKYWVCMRIHTHTYAHACIHTYKDFFDFMTYTYVCMPI